MKLAGICIPLAGLVGLAAAQSVVLNAPPMGTANPVNGTVLGLTIGTPAAYKGILLVSGDNGNTWWDKSHSRYLNLGVPNPGQAQMAGVPLSADGSFYWDQWASSPFDSVASYMRFVILPAAFDLTWPTYQIEGVPIPGKIIAAGVAEGSENRVTGQSLPSILPITVAAPSPAASPGAIVTPVTPVPVAGGAATSLTVTAPTIPAITPITGVTTGLASPATYQAVVYVLSPENLWWGLKAATPLAADGSFSAAGWATDPHDVTEALRIQVFIVPSSFTPPQVLGLAVMPASLTSVAALSVVCPRGGTATAAGSTGGSTGNSTAPSPVPGAAVTLSITAPALGSTGPVTGTLTGQANPAGYKAVVFVLDNAANIWGPKATAALAADGTFSVANWATDANDANGAVKVMVIVAPTAYNAPLVLGVPAFPAAVTASVIVQATAARGATGTGTGTSTGGGTVPTPIGAPSPAASPAGTGGTGGEMAWPPATTGTPVNNGGSLQFGGYNWGIKDSGGGTVGPGPNVFVGNSDFVWTDNWGMHLNVRPTNGCGGWASSELTLDHSLGYGTYFFSTVSPVQNLDPQITIGMFLWDDGAPASIGYREIDFEYSRWGNAGDPTAAQFVLEPLRPGNLPGWRVRFDASQARTFGGANGPQGGGGCNDNTADQFNGAAVNHVSCALNWAAGVLNWYCWDGLYTLETINSAPPGRLLGSYTYPQPQYVPPPGTERFHFNVWEANAGAPAWGRRIHCVVTNFQFTTQQVDFGAMGFASNQGLAGRRMLGAAGLEDSAPVPARKIDTMRAAVRQLGAQVTGEGGAAGGPMHMGVSTAVGIAVGASTMTVLMAIGVALLASRVSRYSKIAGGLGFGGQQAAGEPSHDAPHGESGQLGGGRKQRQLQHERVAPVGT